MVFWGACTSASACYSLSLSFSFSPATPTPVARAHQILLLLLLHQSSLPAWLRRCRERERRATSGCRAARGRSGGAAAASSATRRGLAGWGWGAPRGAPTSNSGAVPADANGTRRSAIGPGLGTLSLGPNAGLIGPVFLLSPFFQSLAAALVGIPPLHGPWLGAWPERRKTWVPLVIFYLYLILVKFDVIRIFEKI